MAGYWTARALDVYNTAGERVLQVKPNLSIFAWLVNLGAYEHRSFTFVLVDGSPHGRQTITSADVADLGPPGRIVACPGFRIFSYPPGSAGYGRLNATIARSLDVDLKQFG